jgi:pimeloyl-ACP methyl ester carboxylesterase
LSSDAGALESFCVTNERDGVRLRCLRWGRGSRVVVAAHGLNAHAWHWRRTAEQLGAEYTFVAFDLRGHGDSDKPSEGYTFEDQGFDIDAVIREVTPAGERPVLIGHSLGSRIVMPYAAEHPPRGLVIVDPGIVAHVNGAPPVRPARRRPLTLEYDSKEQFMERMRRTNFLRNWNAYSDEYAARLIHEPAEHGQPVRLKLTPTALQQTMEAIRAVDVSTYFGQYQCPTLIIRATEGHLSEAMASRMNEEIPDSDLLVIEGSNHNVMLDKPDEFDLALDLFLDRVFA